MARQRTRHRKRGGKRMYNVTVTPKTERLATRRYAVRAKSKVEARRKGVREYRKLSIQRQHPIKRVVITKRR